MNANDIRADFLRFFEERDHRVVPSAPLVPHNDPSLYFVNAGMVPFKDHFTGVEPASHPRAVSAQRCLRVSGKHNDLDNVGRTPRHHTLFEMLGNFSFGDYFKAQAIDHAWTLLTDRWNIDPQRLWITVYEEDDEAFALWREQPGVDESRIQRLGAKDNFWSMGATGPCGPCSEIHYDHGAHIDSNDGGPATESPRYVEIWNLVFMQFDQAPDGSRSALPNPSIDTGMGLERMAAVLQGVNSNYDTDVFQPLLRRASELAKVRMGASEESDTALRVIADHARATALLIGDGVLPSNEGRGYVLRRIMRRGIRFGWKLGLKRPFLHDVTQEVVSAFADCVGQLGDRASTVEEVVRGEEERFRRTLDRGMDLLDRALDESTNATLPGDVAFNLYDTFGFPLDLTEIIASERDIAVDQAGFDRAMEAQRQQGRAAWKGSGATAVEGLWPAIAADHGTTTFTGYDADTGSSKVIALITASPDGDMAQVEALEPGAHGIVLLDRTPFYAESGGQVGDTGTLSSFSVSDTTTAAGLTLHHGTNHDSPLRVGQTVDAAVTAERRNDTRRNHTATHLLHAALRTVLGDHVTQKGSLVAPDKLRFDFGHHKPVSAEQLDAIETMVNREILANKSLDTHLDELEQAIEKGAMALFGEKYDDRVRVVTIPGFSVELCGGTHCARTGDIGLMRITSETGVAAGVRRIEAQTGHGALRTVQSDRRTLQAVSQGFNTSPDDIPDAVARLQADRKALEKKIVALQRASAKDAVATLIGGAKDIGGVQVLAAAFDGDLREQADRLRDRLGSSVVVLAAQRGPKVQLLAAATKDIAGARIHAGKLIQELAPLVGGRGGGRPDLAQAGGTDVAGIDAALARAHELVAAALTDG